VTPNNLLHMATRDFEATFENVLIGEAARVFKHIDGTEHDYIVVSDRLKAEGESSGVFDTAEQAIQAWRDAVKPYEGKAYLYWRSVPEIDQDDNKFDFFARPQRKPNPTFEKWRIYSRFRVLD
jgi:hypothetical protein